MDDIESNDPGQSGQQPSGTRASGWLASLRRGAKGDRPQPDSADDENPFTRFSAVPEDTTKSYSTQVKVTQDAAKRYMHMAPEEELEEQVSRSKQLKGRGVIHPLDRRYRSVRGYDLYLCSGPVN
eukprot:gene3996-4247_t